MSLQDKLHSTWIDSHWRGDVEGFLLYWNGLMVKIEEILPVKQHYTWEMKKLLLRSAVNGHPHLASVDKLDRDQITRGQAPMRYEDYFNVLQNAAQQVDHENRLNKHPMKRIVNYLDMTQEEYDELSSPPSMAELSVSKVQTKVPFKCPVDPQDPNTLSVPYDLFIKLPPCVKMLIWEAQKAEPGYEQCKVSLHEVNNVSSEDLAPDIDNLEISGYQDDADMDGGDAGDQEVDDDQQILAHVTWHKVLPPSDIRRVLAAQQSQVSQKFMQKDPGKAKKTITIDGVVYVAKVHNVVYSISKH